MTRSERSDALMGAARELIPGGVNSPVRAYRGVGGIVQQVRQLARENTPTRVIGLKVGHTENSVRSIASNNNISLKPTNQSPYGTKRR